MSRSIHETRRQLEDLKRDSYSDAEDKNSLVESHREALRTKSLVKRLAKSSAHPSDSALSQIPIVEIRYLQANREIHYLISEAEIHELVSRLPVGILAGVSRIDFCLGTQYMEESDSNVEDASRDPYLGRLGEKVGGQVYIPPVLGTYFSETNLIAIYAYIFQDDDIRDKEFLTLCKIRMLCTLLHEIAHHDDHMRRGGRGRWLGLHSTKAEDFAIRMERSWSQTVLVKYLEEHLRSETDELLRWLTQITSIQISLSDILSMTFIGSGWDTISDYIAQEQYGSEGLFQLAEDFHLNDQYEICLRCLDALLLLEPRNANALCLKADTLIHLGKNDEADSLIDIVLHSQPRHFQALHLKCDILWNQEKWQELLLTTEKALELVEPRKWYLRFGLQRARIMSFLFLQNLDAAKEVCLTIEERGSYKNRKKALLGFLDLISKNPEPAIRACETILQNEKAYRFEKCVAYYTYQIALKVRNKSGSFYQKPSRVIHTVEHIGLVKAIGRYFPELQSSNINFNLTYLGVTTLAKQGSRHPKRRLS